MNRIKKFFFINWLSIALVVVLSACSFFIYSTAASIIDYYQLSGNVDGIISADAVYCKLSGNSTVDLTQTVTDPSFKKVNLFLKTDNRALKAYEVLLMNKPPFSLESGRGFVAADCLSGERVAVVGANAHEITDVDNLIIDSMSYQTIGRLKNETIVSQNYMLLYSNGNIGCTPVDRLLIIDGSAQEVNKAFRQLKKIAVGQALTVERLDVETISLDRFFVQRGSILFIIEIAAALLFLVYLLLIVFWLYSKEQYIGVCNIIGVPRLKTRLFFEFFRLYLIAFAITTPLALLIYRTVPASVGVILTVLAVSSLVVSPALLIGLMLCNTKNTMSILESDYE